MHEIISSSSRCHEKKGRKQSDKRAVEHRPWQKEIATHIKVSEVGT